MSREPVYLTPNRRSRAEGSRVVEEHLRSNLSLKAFRQQHSPDHSTLIRCLKHRQNLSAQAAQPPGRLPIERASETDAVSVSAPRGVMLVVAGGRCIERARSFDAAGLHRLLRLLVSR